MYVIIVFMRKYAHTHLQHFDWVFLPAETARRTSLEEACVKVQHCRWKHCGQASGLREGVIIDNDLIMITP